MGAEPRENAPSAVAAARALTERVAAVALIRRSSISGGGCLATVGRVHRSVPCRNPTHIPDSKQEAELHEGSASIASAPKQIGLPDMYTRARAHSSCSSGSTAKLMTCS